MLLNLREYYRPGEDPARKGLEHALALLARERGRAVAMAGGSTLLASRDPAIEAVVDLQGLNLDEIAVDGDRVRIGAMATRAALAAQSHRFRALKAGAGAAQDLGRLGLQLAEAAARWSGSVQRNRATVGGAVAVAAPEDLLVLALLAADAAVVLATPEGERAIPLADFLPDRRRLLAQPALITNIVVAPSGNGKDAHSGAGMATVARTPADEPIVAAVAIVRRAEGRCLGARLALGGVSPEPVNATTAAGSLAGQPWSATLVNRVGAELAAAVQPVADFRGSVEYRRAMVGVLSERALMEAWERAT